MATPRKPAKKSPNKPLKKAVKKPKAAKKPVAAKKPIATKKPAAPKKPTPKKAAAKKAAAKKPVPKKAKTARPKAAKPKTAPRRRAKVPATDAKTKAPASGAKISLDEVLGQIVRVLSVSPQHSKMSLADLRLRVVPPLRLGYCRVLRGDDGHPLAYAAWARVSNAVHARLESSPEKAHAELKPEEWNSGPHPWLIDQSPPPQAIPQVLAELQTNVFKGEKVRTLLKSPTVGRGKME